MPECINGLTNNLARFWKKKRVFSAQVSMFTDVNHALLLRLKTCFVFFNYGQ
jgi:hypothetical protein